MQRPYIIVERVAGLHRLTNLARFLGVVVFLCTRAFHTGIGNRVYVYICRHCSTQSLVPFKQRLTIVTCLLRTADTYIRLLRLFDESLWLDYRRISL